MNREKGSHNFDVSWWSGWVGGGGTPCDLSNKTTCWCSWLSTDDSRTGLCDIHHNISSHWTLHCIEGDVELDNNTDIQLFSIKSWRHVAGSTVLPRAKWKMNVLLLLYLRLTISLRQNQNPHDQRWLSQVLLLRQNVLEFTGIWTFPMNMKRL